jgi:hypothetical protein
VTRVLEDASKPLLAAARSADVSIAAAAKVVKSGAVPAVQSAVARGQITPDEAVAIAELPEAQQKGALKKRKRREASTGSTDPLACWRRLDRAVHYCYAMLHKSGLLADEPAAQARRIVKAAVWTDQRSQAAWLQSLRGIARGCKALEHAAAESA